jgi:poly-gamma-glutamate biosynthesis protein PgsC/CapC
MAAKGKAMSPEAYIVAGIILGLLFTEFTGLSPGGIIVPGYLALFLLQPMQIALTVAAAALTMLTVKLFSKVFFLFGHRRYALYLLLGIMIKLGIEYFSNFAIESSNIMLIGWLIPGIIANDMHKQGIPRTLLAAATVTALVFLLAQGFGFVFN